MQDYFSRVLEILRNGKEIIKDTGDDPLSQILHSLRSDRGHYNLVPYFITQFSNDVTLYEYFLDKINIKRRNQ